VAVGDGANDLEMLQRAGMGVAFHAKAILKQKTRVHLSSQPLVCLAAYLGLDLTLGFEPETHTVTEDGDWIMALHFLPKEKVLAEYCPSLPCCL
jgi:hypothetical protein